jgi:hypothetical protein
MTSSYHVSRRIITEFYQNQNLVNTRFNLVKYYDTNLREEVFCSYEDVPHKYKLKVSKTIVYQKGSSTEGEKFHIPHKIVEARRGLFYAARAYRWKFDCNILSHGNISYSHNVEAQLIEIPQVVWDSCREVRVYVNRNVKPRGLNIRKV